MSSESAPSGWDVAVIEFRLLGATALARAVDGRFTVRTAAALRRYQRRHGLVPDGIAGPNTYRSLARRATVRIHVVRPGESFFAIAARYHVSPWQLARRNRVPLMRVIVPGQRLVLPAERVDCRQLRSLRRATRSALRSASGLACTASTRSWRRRSRGWSRASSTTSCRAIGAIGVMQLLPETWEFVDTVLLGQRTPRNYEGNVRAGVRYLRWQLDHFGGDVRLALAGWYQGAGGPGDRLVRRHEAVRPGRALAARHSLSEVSLAKRDSCGLPQLERAAPARLRRGSSDSFLDEPPRRTFVRRSISVEGT